eukprot:GHRR01000155.1.p2 GENE.GHRR01000155.1~~GHRR01000155.1.p2  ORF type:complete len:122 (+),score=44.48 GHRR01000155.1:402-767(+)
MWQLADRQSAYAPKLGDGTQTAKQPQTFRQASAFGGFWQSQQQVKRHTRGSMTCSAQGYAVFTGAAAVVSAAAQAHHADCKNDLTCLSCSSSSNQVWLVQRPDQGYCKAAMTGQEFQEWLQ